MPNLKFFVHPGQAGDGLAFDLLLDEEQVLSRGGFADREDCLTAIRAAVEALGAETPFVFLPAPGGQAVGLVSPTGAALASSRPLASEAAMTLRDALAEAASEQEEYGIEFPPTMTMRQRAVPAFLSAAHQVSTDDYDFGRPSSSGVAGFESFQNDRDGRYYFHFNDAQGAALLYSRGFGTTAQRNKRLRSVMDGGVLTQRYEQREEGGSHFFILKARNGQEIARSRAFPASGERDAAMAWLAQVVPQHAEQSGPLRTRRPRRPSHTGIALASLTGAAGFELLRNSADRRHYFLFNGDDGRPLLFSQGYKTGESRDQAVRTLIRLSANPSRYEAARAEGEHSFVVRAGNRQEIARSRAFESGAAAAVAMGLLQARLPDLAAPFGVPAETLETRTGERLTIRAERERSPLVAAAVGVGALAALGEAARAEAPRVPVASVAPVAGTEAVGIPTTSESAAPLPDSRGKAAPRSNAAGWGRLWPVALAVLALACVPLFLFAHRQPPPPPIQAPGSDLAARRSANPLPVRIAVKSYIASAGSSPAKAHPGAMPALLGAAGAAGELAGVRAAGAAGHPQAITAQGVRPHRRSLTPAALGGDETSAGSEIMPRPRAVRHQPDLSVLYGQGS